MAPSLLRRSLTTAGFILGAFALAVAAGTWTPPSSSPPSGNVDAPVNIGSVTQTKVGWLGVRGLVATDLTLATGTPAVGDVLTAVDTLGNATWQAPTGGSGGDGALPAPNYDSGWVNFVSTGAYPGWSYTRSMTLTHNLGTENTLVYLEVRGGYAGNSGINNMFNGVEDTSSNNQYGYTWTDKTNTTIRVVSGDNEPANGVQVRVRMWIPGTAVDLSDLTVQSGTYCVRNSSGSPIILEEYNNGIHQVTFSQAYPAGTEPSVVLTPFSRDATPIAQNPEFAIQTINNSQFTFKVADSDSDCMNWFAMPRSSGSIQYKTI